MLLGLCFIQTSLRRVVCRLPRTILTFAHVDITSLSHQISVIRHHRTNKLLPITYLEGKLPALYPCTMSKQSAALERSSSRKRKFDSLVTGEEDPSSLSSSISVATSPLRTSSDDEDAVEFDFKHGSVLYRAKRHKMSSSLTPPRKASNNPALPASQITNANPGVHGDDLSPPTCIPSIQSPLTGFQSHDTQVPERIDTVISSPSLLLTQKQHEQQLQHQMESKLTEPASYSGFDNPKVAHAAKVASCESHDNKEMQPFISSMQNAPELETMEKEMPCSSSDRDTSTASSDLVFIENYYAQTDKVQSSTSAEVEKHSVESGENRKELSFEMKVPQTPGTDVEMESTLERESPRGDSNPIEETDPREVCPTPRPKEVFDGAKEAS